MPEDISSYQSVWYIEAYEGLTADEVTRLVAYARAGGHLYLTGERPCCEQLNASVQQVLDGTLVDQDVQVGGMGDIGGPFAFNADVTDYVSTVPNLLVDFLPDSPGGLDGIGGINHRNVLASSATTAVGAVWSEQDMQTGHGRIAMLMDIDWLQDPSRLPIIENLANFLSAGGLCFGDSGVVTWAAGPPSCSVLNTPATTTWRATSTAGAPTMEATGDGVEVECDSMSAGNTTTLTCQISNAESTGASLRVLATAAGEEHARFYRVRPKNDPRNVPSPFALDSNWWNWPDADDDGLPDKWENDGVWVKDTYLDLPGEGADPRHKDLFVRYDYASGEMPSEDTLAFMRQMFDRAPLTNPDGTDGVRLHIATGAEVPTSIIGNYDLTPANIIRVGTYTGYLNSPGYGGSGVPTIYKSMLNFAQKPGTSTIGRGFFKGNFAWTAWDVNNAEAALNINFPVWSESSRQLAESFAEASNAAHELGHLLGLHHHGAQDTPQQDKDYLST